MHRSPEEDAFVRKYRTLICAMVPNAPLTGEFRMAAIFARIDYLDMGLPLPEPAEILRTVESGAGTARKLELNKT